MSPSELDSNSLLIHPLSFPLVTFSYKPTQDGEQRVLPFAVVTAVDLLSLLIFLLQRQIGRWHDILTLDIEQGHFGVEEEDAAATQVGGPDEQREQRDFDARPQAGRHTSSIAEDQTGVGGHIADYREIEWPAMMVREEGRMNQQPDQPEEENTFIHAPRGPRSGGGVPPTVGSPATVTDNDRHPALRPDNNVSGPMPPGASHLETSRPEQNQF
jgi:hypothetical protein